MCNHTQQPLILYQLETVPAPIIDKNTEVDSYMQLQIRKPYIALNSKTYINIRQQELATCKKIGYEFYCEELFVVRHKSRYHCVYEQFTLNSSYNEEINVEIFLHYRWLFIMGDVFIGEWEIFGAEIFLHYSQSFIKGDFIIDRVECILTWIRKL